MIIKSLFKKKMEPDRPKIRPEMSPADWMIEAIAFLLLFALAGYTIYWFQRLPETIPSHFNLRGEIDGYGSRGSLWFLPAVALFIWLLMTIINRFPHTFNYLKTITPENAPRQYLLATRFIRITKGIVIAIFFLIESMMVRGATVKDPGPFPLLMVVIIGVTFIPLIIYLIASAKK